MISKLIKSIEILTSCKQRVPRAQNENKCCLIFIFLTTTNFSNHFTAKTSTHHFFLHYTKHTETNHDSGCYETDAKCVIRPKALQKVWWWTHCKTGCLLYISLLKLFNIFFWSWDCLMHWNLHWILKNLEKNTFINFNFNLKMRKIFTKI